MLTSQRPRTIASLAYSNGIGGTARPSPGLLGGGSGRGAGAMSSPVARVVLGVATLAAMAGLALLVWSRSQPEQAVAGPDSTLSPSEPLAGLTPTNLPPTGDPEPPGPVVLSMAGPGPAVTQPETRAAREPSTSTTPTAPTAPTSPAPRGPSALPLEIPSPGTAQRPPTSTPRSTPTSTPTPTIGTTTIGTPSTASSPIVRTTIADAQALIKHGKPLAARDRLNKLLYDRDLARADAGLIKAELSELNQTLLFSPTVTPGDSLTDAYTIASGDTLARITRRQGLPIDWRLLVRINRLSSENAIRVGQTIKLVRLPFHAVVSKADYRMDVWAGPPVATGSPLGPLGQGEGWTYVRSFRVGLGESNGTPEGLFVVRPSSKLINPRWVNPRTGEVFEANDENNPIGERWIGLDGADDATRAFTGYGIHGTIDPQSVGQQRSMGCVRLDEGDVELVYELLVERLSSVRIVK
jgi:lipoprotein-anchoring transpeptidase ErfK/SrfK